MGKSTELTRLIEDVQARFRVVRFSVTDELDANAFEPFDVLVLMMVRLAEQCALPLAEGGAGLPPSDDLLRDVFRWFAEETATQQYQTELGVAAQAGLGAGARLALVEGCGALRQRQG